MWDQMMRGFSIHAILVDGVLAATAKGAASGKSK